MGGLGGCPALVFCHCYIHQDVEQQECPFAFVFLVQLELVRVRSLVVEEVESMLGIMTVEVLSEYPQ